MAYCGSTSSHFWMPFIKFAQFSCRAKCDKWNVAPNLIAHNPDKLGLVHAQKVREVKEGLWKVEGNDTSQNLVMVDAIQRLALDHHFQEEIDDILWRIHVERGDFICKSQDIHQVSLYFRLMRQEGYHVSAGVFLNFKDEEGRLETSELRKDVSALMTLYEASQLSIEGEDILEEFGDFSRKLLNLYLIQIDHNNNSTIIANTLSHPFHRSLPRFMAETFCQGFKGKNGWEKPLKELANTEFHIARRIHNQELLHACSWWKNTGLTEELKDARDQPLKWYTWPMAMFTDLSLSEERIDLSKCISFVYIIDDIFDLYGTPDELTLFTDAVNRWELSVANQLPDYMKKCFKSLYDTTNEIAHEIQIKHGSSNPIGYLRKSWARLCRAYLVEAKWFASQDLPKADEYLENGILSSGVEVVLVHVFFLLGLGATEDCSTNLNRVSGIISSVSKILRLWDDLGSAKDEDQNGHDGSYMNCYMNENKGVSIDFAREHIQKLISDEWKQLNRECIGLSRFAPSFKKAALNLARMVPLMYDYDANQHLPLLEHFIKSMLK